MRILIFGGSGVIGAHLIPLLVEQGHSVAATTRTPERLATLEALGATAFLCDILERDSVVETAAAFEPELVMHQVTALPDDQEEMESDGDRLRALNIRIRREGTQNIVVAAQKVGARVLAQSVAWEVAGEGGAAMQDLEQRVLASGGMIVRYGRFYGPGTWYAESPGPPAIAIDEAARQTAELVAAPSGVATLLD